MSDLILYFLFLFVSSMKLNIIFVVFLIVGVTSLSLQVNKARHELTLNEFRQGQLNKHNQLRGRHQNTPNLVLDASLNTEAQAYAEVLASQNQDFSASLFLEHSTTQNGENLYIEQHPVSNCDAYNQYAQQAGWDLVYHCDYVSGAASQSWYDQIDNYDFSTGSSSNGRVVGHFTQLVWKDTARVGFGRATVTFGNDAREIIVAQYSPPGNRVTLSPGQSYAQAKLQAYTENVQPLKAGA